MYEVPFDEIVKLLSAGLRPEDSLGMMNRRMALQECRTLSLGVPRQRGATMWALSKADMDGHIYISLLQSDVNLSRLNNYDKWNEVKVIYVDDYLITTSHRYRLVMDAISAFAPKDVTIIVLTTIAAQ